MGYLRHSRLSSPRRWPASKEGCFDAYERELDYLFGTLQRLGAAPREIEDLAQEVFAVLYRAWPSSDLTGSFRPYLFSVAFRVVRAHRRRRGHEISYSELKARDGAEGALPLEHPAQPFLAALDRIPLLRRAVVIMHDLDGFSIVDVAAKLSITRCGAYLRLRRARTELASALRRSLRIGADEQPR
jgi:RNA polymerase sigma-70 factor (ECF subfamily)